MRKVMGEYKSSLIKLFNSFKKRFGLDHGETLEYVDGLISDKDYAVLYFASDGTYSKEFIEEINSSGVGQAYGFFLDSYSSVDELKEAVPRIIGDGGNKFIFVELGERSRFRLEEIPKTVFVKQGREMGEFSIDIVKSREYIEDEVIRKVEREDLDNFNILYHDFYVNRWTQRSDIFIKNMKLSKNDFYSMCRGSSDTGAFVCYKKDQMVGFILFESIYEKDNRFFNDNCYLTVRDIYVVPEFRRQGIATRMFREVKRIADKNCLKYVRFKTWAFDEEMVGFVKSLDNKELYAMYEIEV